MCFHFSFTREVTDRVTDRMLQTTQLWMLLLSSGPKIESFSLGEKKKVLSKKDGPKFPSFLR